jgi:flagellar basal-body rod protein FlgB
MSSAIDRLFNLHQTALSVRGSRSEVIASNIANADTPGYQARDLDFKVALSSAIGQAPAKTLQRTHARHLAGAQGSGGVPSAQILYRTVTQASIDNNTVDINVERAQFADNAMRLEASLVFLNGKIKSLLAAIQN